MAVKTVKKVRNSKPVNLPIDPMLVAMQVLGQMLATIKRDLDAIKLQLSKK